MVVYSAPRPPGVIVGMRAAQAHLSEEQPLTTNSVKVLVATPEFKDSCKRPRPQAFIDLMKRLHVWSVNKNMPKSAS